MSDTSQQKVAFWLGVVMPIVLPMAIAVIVLPGLFVRAWAGTVIWNWFAPWPMPLSLVQIAGLMLAYGVVFARDSGYKDERTLSEKAAGYLAVNAVLPICALAVGWLLTLWA